jgi:hypothetical protein
MASSVSIPGEGTLMQSITKFFGRFGSAGTAIANVLVFLTTNWGVVMSAVLGLVAAIYGGAYDVASNPRVQVGIGTFVAVLWTIIGILVLVDRRKPRLIRSYQDYRYGLTFEGMSPILDKDNEEAALQFSLQLRNYSMGPIQYAIEHFDVRIGSRALPEWKSEGKTVYMPRGAEEHPARSLLKKTTLKSSMGKE